MFLQEGGRPLRFRWNSERYGGIMGCMERIMHTKADQEDNGISCGTADEDGIMLKENVTGTGIYIY